ncbi:MAG: hypothetical protein RL708_1867 [Bacteroidota bacterium]
MRKFKFPDYTKVIIFLTVMNIIIMTIRNWYVDNTVFNFLWRNLWSSFCPLLVATLLLIFNEKINKFFFWIGCFVWLIFYPNAPYMISDLIHNSLDPSKIPNQVIYDTIIIFSIAMLSLFYGFISMKIIFNLIFNRYNKMLANGAVACTLILSSVGFYMGRLLASGIHYGNGLLYSWELFIHPIVVLKVAWHAMFPIGQHIPDYLLMLLFGIVQYMILIMMKDVSDVQKVEISDTSAS